MIEEFEVSYYWSRQFTFSVLCIYILLFKSAFSNEWSHSLRARVTYSVYVQCFICNLRPIHTRELAPATRSRNRFAPGACSLIFNQFDSMEQNPGAKCCCATIFFAWNHWYRRGSFAPGACCGSVLQEQSPSCEPAFRWCLQKVAIN